MRGQRTKTRSLWFWVCTNVIIFVLCYLNYLLQLKHRYLYGLLNVGLCFSRAAAMVINFNLLLVWIPMCKYSLTRLAYLANLSQQCQRQLLTSLTKQNIARINLPVSAIYLQYPAAAAHAPGGESMTSKLKSIKADIIYKLTSWSCRVKIDALHSFQTAVDHCLTLHTICARTITIASVVHTVAHLMNVINFSKNYDPFLTNLNMADYKDQNPLQLLVSVPGITGSLMLVILILMSLSSADLIRNSSYDLFRIFHRLSIVFVFLLIIHPSAHILKEQNNVDRHNPDICNRSIWRDSNSTAPSSGSNQDGNLSIQGRHYYVERINQQQRVDLAKSTANATTGQTESSHNLTASRHLIQTISQESRRLAKKVAVVELASNLNRSRRAEYSRNHRETTNYKLSDCLDQKPTFVSQSSICWYALGVGLSFYLVDLLLRKLRRSKSTIQLLDYNSDCEGNLIELVLSNNHKRFSHWLPGQFVYLNCPKIATYEWHPFTISSMDNEKRQFTLHIKTGGDWTRELRHKLEQSPRGSLFERNLSQTCLSSYDNFAFSDDCKSPRLVRVVNRHDDLMMPSDDCPANESRLDPTQVNSISRDFDLFIDGPFHSPFERLLEQQVSVCIANGVGWTAFSSVFPCITNNMVDQREVDPKAWWSKWSRFRVPDGNSKLSTSTKLPDTRLHLVVIVTTFEQLKPFYNLALAYFDNLINVRQMQLLDQANPVREVKAFITRSASEDQSRIEDLVRRDNLTLLQDDKTIKVNDLFSIHFGKPCFEDYIAAFATIYPNHDKVSVYCCGSYQVKKAVQEVCQSLNLMSHNSNNKQTTLPTTIANDVIGAKDGKANRREPRRKFFSYHEENF